METTIPRDITEYKVNNRIAEVLERCSDANAIRIAEEIASMRLAGYETWSLEKLLEAELSRMKTATRVFFGRVPRST